MEDYTKMNFFGRLDNSYLNAKIVVFSYPRFSHIIRLSIIQTHNYISLSFSFFLSGF